MNVGEWSIVHDMPGYQLIHEIEQKRGIKLYRMMRLADRRMMIAKTTSDEYPSATMVAAFRYEYETLCKLEGRGTLEVYSLEMNAERPVLLLQDCGGHTLAHTLHARSDTMRLSELMQVAIAIVDCIRQLHYQQITLHEITPDHFMVNMETYEVKCIDIRMCSTDMHSSPVAHYKAHTDEVLPYIAPEQTGRTGAVADYRSDYYSLGILLYQWFARELPFEGQDVLNVVYHHLASTPIPLYLRVSDCPKMISDIISKCMEKMPDARYVSAYGIKYDLEECYSRLQFSNDIEPFMLGEHDISDRWLISNSFYGRVEEQERLQLALQRAAFGSFELALVSGVGGIGKTSFVLETLQKATDKVGFIGVSKLSPNHEPQPYEVWAQVMDELVSQLLTSSKLQIEVWRLRILSAVNDLGQLLIELVPKLQMLIGEQPAVPKLPPVEAQLRFQLILNRFIQLFMEQGQPLVLFLDDMHWADEASLQYLAYLLREREMKHLLIIVSYRDNEVTSEHPLKRLLDGLHLEQVKVEQVQLVGLDRAALMRLISEAMRMNASKTLQLSEVLHYKTEGNPFVLKQMIQDALIDGLIRFDHDSRSWTWDMKRIAEMEVLDDEVNYLLSKFPHLSSDVIHTIGCAAFLGSRFELNILLAITKLDSIRLSEALSIATQERLLQPIEYEGVEGYKFQHDRIQQAAYSIISPSERSDLHLQIGMYLTEKMKSDGDNQVFKIVNHLNRASDQLQEPEQKLALAELNLQAGMKAKQATAYESSLPYLRQATALLETDSWSKQYSLTFQAYKERAEAEFLCVHLAEAEELFELLLQKTTNDLDKALVYTAMIQLESSRENYDQLIQLGCATLKVLGVKHNEKPSNAQVIVQLLRLRQKLHRFPLERFEHLPAMTDERRKIAMAVLVYMTNAYFNSKGNKRVWASATFLMLELTLEYGMTEEASIGYAGYAMFSYYALRQYDKTYEWSIRAITLAQSNPLLYVKTLTAFAVCEGSWRSYYPQFTEIFNEYAGRVGLEAGDIWQSNQSILTYCAISLQSGYPLQGIYDRLLAHSSLMLRNKDSFQWRLAALASTLLSRLTGYRAPDDPYAAIDVEAAEFASSVHGDSYEMTQDVVYTICYIPDYLFGNYERANEAAAKSIALAKERQDDIDTNSGLYMYQSLILAAICDQLEPSERSAHYSTIRFALKKLKKYAKRLPINHQHKYLLAKAELCRLTGKDRQAERLYEQSIECARRQGFNHDLAMAAECYGKYGLSRGREQLAKVYMMEAYEAYVKWGANAKVAILVEKYGHMLNIYEDSSLDRVDYLSLFKSTQALTGEMEIGKLLETLMRIMLHNTGAEYGALILENEGSFTVEAFGTSRLLQMVATPLEEATDIVPTAIIGYTARTREALVLHDAAREGMFARSPYVRQQQLKSILCLPLIHQNQIVALLYLENKLSTHVFTRERIDVLKLLCAQCAISIQNAKLYSDMQRLKISLEEQVVERTRSLEVSMMETSAALAERSIYSERNRIAQEIHDIVGHTLTSTMFQIEAGKRLMYKDMAEAAARLQEAQNLVRHSLNEIRGSVHMLKEDKYFNIEDSLRQLLRSTEHNMGVTIHEVIHELPQLSIEHKKTMYHALQEGLTNGIRHGGSTEFHFRLETDGTCLLFTLHNNGKGANEMQPGFGLKSMRERVEMLGGSMCMESKSSTGCTLTIELPYLYAIKRR